MTNKNSQTPFWHNIGPLPLALPIAIGLIWSYLVRDLEFLNPLPDFVKITLTGVLIAAICAVYLPIRFHLEIGRRHIHLFLLCLALIIGVNGHVIWEALACDELYHSGVSSLAFRTIEKISSETSVGQFLRKRPMTESIALVSVCFLFTAGWVVHLWFSLKKRLLTKISEGRFNFFGIWMLATVIGYTCRLLASRTEIHPPLRLLPIFLSQTIFGYDDLSFRIPGIVAFAFIAAAVANFVFSRRQESDPSRWFLAVLTGVLVCLVPTVAHSATIVEPSFWCFATWVLSFLLLDRYLREGDERFLVAASVCIGLGSLMRQNAVVLWPIVGLVLIWKRPNAWTCFRAILPGVFVLPYFFMVFKGNHPASSATPLTSVMNSLQDGKGFFLILQSTTPPWVGFGLCLLVWAVCLRWWKQVPGLVVVIALLPAYFLYFSISDYLWGLGRYQAEYIGSALVILMATAASQVTRRFVATFAVAMLVLGFYSIGVLRTLHYDTFYDIWPHKRITTESLYPYREAFGFLHRQDVKGRFVIVGGVPNYGEWAFYMRGFSYTEMKEQHEIQAKFEAFVVPGTDLSGLQMATKALGITHVIVQWGDKRELQHRAGWHSNVESLLIKANRAVDSHMTLEHRFYGNLEGAIDIYRVEG